MKNNKKSAKKNQQKHKTLATVSTKEYAKTLLVIKKHVQKVRIKVMLAANKELIKLYWYIGKTITEKQERDGWGTSIVECLANDLQNAFPGVGGFSRANIFRMRAFYSTYEKVAQAARQFEELAIFSIPWGHNVIILQKLKNSKEQLWYAQKAIEVGWSRSLLEAQIKSDVYHREGRAITNFSKTLSASDSDMAKLSFKDPYLFDFLTLRDDYVEQELEQGLIDHIQRFLLELGQGFAFVGRQKHIEVDKTDFYIDLLFYHLKLRCYIVVELKSTDFKPEYAGKLNFYLSAVDDLLRMPGDKPTIGLLLCKTKNNIVAEYALRDINKPIGVAGYETKLVESLPKELKSSLPTVEEIEAEFEKNEIFVGKTKKRCGVTRLKSRITKYKKVGF